MNTYAVFDSRATRDGLQGAGVLEEVRARSTTQAVQAVGREYAGCSLWLDTGETYQFLMYLQ